MKMSVCICLAMFLAAAPAHALLGLPVDDIIGDIVGDVLELIEDLPDPIHGPDKFETDNTPLLAFFTGLLNLDHFEILGREPFRYAHNFHEQGDEDWMTFFALEGQDVAVRTRDLYPQADTHLSVYRALEPGELAPGEVPDDCLEASITLESGEILVPLACNDDFETDGNLRSEVRFFSPMRGRFWVRVMQSPKHRNKSSNAEETTYNYEATTKFAYASTLVASLRDRESGDAVGNGEIFVTPINVRVSENRDGNYTLNGIPDGSYTVRATAPSYDADQRFVRIASGEIHFENFPLRFYHEPEGEAEGEVTVEGERDVEGEAEGETVHEGEVEGETGTGMTFDHKADFRSPYGVVDISELLRVVQLFNVGAFHCAAGTEDGYGTGPGETTCAPHSMDFVDANFQLDLRELLRAVQFFNLGGYHPCEGTEDGYCPGPPLS